jgi:hypothetical protein
MITENRSAALIWLHWAAVALHGSECHPGAWDDCPEPACAEARGILEQPRWPAAGPNCGACERHGMIDCLDCTVVRVLQAHGMKGPNDTRAKTEGDSA